MSIQQRVIMLLIGMFVVLWFAVILMAGRSMYRPVATAYVDTDGKCVEVVTDTGAHHGCDFIRGKREGVDYAIEPGASKEMRDEQRRYERRQRFQKNGAVEM